MKRSDIYIAILLCVFAVMVFYASDTIRTMAIVERSPIINSRFYPKLLSVLLFVCGIAIGAQALTRKQTEATVEKSSTSQGLPETQAAIPMYLTGLACLLYLVLFVPLGFLLSTVLFMAALLWLLGSKKWHGILIPAVLVPVAIYLLFSFLLGVPLPRGIFAF